MWGVFLFGYVMFGAMASVVGWDVVTDDGTREFRPPGSEPAFRFLFGLFWPLAVVAAVAYLLFLIVGSIAGGFAVIWRHWRGVRIARATARKRRR